MFRYEVGERIFFSQNTIDQATIDFYEQNLCLTFWFSPNSIVTMRTPYDIDTRWYRLSKVKTRHD